MHDENSIVDILLDIPKVADVVPKPIGEFKGVKYENFISCSLYIDTQIVPIFIGKPEHWEQKLFDIYIEGFKEFPYIPHVDYKNGKLCLYDLEGILIDINPSGLLKACIARAIAIILDGINKKNEIDFISEFSSYWCKLPDIGWLKQDIVFQSDCQKIKYTQNAGNKKANTLREVFASGDIESFKTWSINGTQSNGIAIFFRADSYVYPPDIREPKLVEYINHILENIPVSKFQPDCSKIINKEPRELLLIFQIEQPNGMKTDLSVLLKNSRIKAIDEFYQIMSNDSMKIYPLATQRIDKAFLMNRIKDSASPATKKCLLIGCGSIGGYIANELIKAGVDQITFVDNDKLKEENIYRHILGIKYVECNKAKALSIYFTKNIPHLKLHYENGNIKELVKNSSIDFETYDFIVSATGNHNINRWINSEVIFREIETPIFYVWNEPLDIGCHAAVIQLSQNGCYECFFKRNKGQLYDSTAYTDPSNNVVDRNVGCGGSYIPYGASISIKSASLCMDLITRYFDGRCQTNVLASLKGDGFYFQKADYKVSGVYNNQSDYINIIDGSTFYNTDCSECNNK